CDNVTVPLAGDAGVCLPLRYGDASRRALGVLAAAGALGWVTGTAEFARARIAPGPRTRDEVTSMLVTSALIPPLAVTHWMRGWWRTRASVTDSRRAVAGS
ncbi:hypothetical protein V6U81_21580, partial [Micromonospora sp. CPCC 205711]